MMGGADRTRFMSVQNAMTRNVITVKMSDRVLDVWMLMMERDISGAPVVDDEGLLIGVLSVTDLNRSILERMRKAASLREVTTEIRDKESEIRDLAREMSLSVRAVIEGRVSSLLPATPPVISLGPSDSLDRAVKIMAEKSVNRLPVVREGRVIGIITRQDVIEIISGRPRQQERRTDEASGEESKD